MSEKLKRLENFQKFEKEHIKDELPYVALVDKNFKGNRVWDTLVDEFKKEFHIRGDLMRRLSHDEELFVCFLDKYYLQLRDAINNMIDNETLARESENLYACLKDDDKDIGLQMFADEHSAAIM